MRFAVIVGLALVGCSDPDMAKIDVPPIGTGGAPSQGRPPAHARAEDLRAATGEADLPETLCDEAFLSAGFELGDEPTRTLYVAASSLDDPADGTPEAPFRTLSDAVAFAGDGPATLLVAAGDYEDYVTLSPGIRAVGGYDAESWTPALDPARVSRLKNVAFRGSSDPGLISELARFTVEGGLSIGRQVRLVLRDNLLTPEPIPVAVEPPLDPFLATAVLADGAFLLAYRNRVRIPSSTPEQVFSTAFDLRNSCARLTDNDLGAYRTPVSARDSEVVFNFNSVVGGMNGLHLIDSVGSVTGNYFYLEGPKVGLTYAVYLVSSPPVLRHNEFHLSGRGVAGVNEASLDSDPLQLVDNQFYLHEEARFMYLDRHEDGQTGLEWLDDIELINSLSDIPEVSGNVAFFDP